MGFTEYTELNILDRNLQDLQNIQNTELIN
jgi:hypothetical protein